MYVCVNATQRNKKKWENKKRNRMVLDDGGIIKVIYLFVLLYIKWNNYFIRATIISWNINYFQHCFNLDIFVLQFNVVYVPTLRLDNRQITSFQFKVMNLIIKILLNVWIYQQMYKYTN